jgi:hypothetical protein
MRTFLCVVSPRFPENYHIGVQARKWGVEGRYHNRIHQVSRDDEVVFIASREIRSIHQIESGVFRDNTPLWPPKDGDLFPFRIKISAPTYAGAISSGEFVPHISFMRNVQAWGGTIQGASGVFNDRLTDEDVTFIKSRLRKIPVIEPAAARAVEEPKIKNLFRLIDSSLTLPCEVQRREFSC